MVEGDQGYSDQYFNAYNSLVEWSEARRNATPPVASRLIDRRTDREIVDNTTHQLLYYFPVVTQALESAQSNNELVYTGGEDLVEGFPNSPYARMHVGLQNVRRLLIDEALIRGENIREVPDNITDQLYPASLQLNNLPQPSIPHLDPETIHNLSRFGEKNRVAWELFLDGMNSMHELLARTVAVKLKFAHSSPVLGYNKRAVEFSELMLLALDAVGGCSPWQMAWNPDEYYAKVASASKAHITYADRLKMWHHLQDGKMWSTEMAEDPQVDMWLRRLKTGEI